MKRCQPSHGQASLMVAIMGFAQQRCKRFLFEHPEVLSIQLQFHPVQLWVQCVAAHLRHDCRSTSLHNGMLLSSITIFIAVAMAMPFLPVKGLAFLHVVSPGLVGLFWFWTFFSSSFLVGFLICQRKNHLWLTVCKAALEVDAQPGQQYRKLVPTKVAEPGQCQTVRVQDLPKA